MANYNGGTPKIKCSYTPKPGEYLFVLHRYKKQTSYDGATTCINGYVFDAAANRIICDSIESQTYVSTKSCLKAGRHTIQSHMGGSWETESSHKPQANYARKYKSKSDGNGAMLAIDGTGCLFHMGKGANDKTSAKPWSQGCVLLGSNPGGANGFPNFAGVKGPGSSSPDTNASGWMNFYDNVYPHLLKGETVVIFIIEDQSVQHPGGAGADGIGAGVGDGSVVGGSVIGGVVANPMGIDSSRYTNGNGSFSGTEWGKPIEGNASGLYKMKGSQKSTGVILGTHIRQQS